MVSPILYGRFPERLATRVLEAASSEGVTVSKWLRQAALERLGAVSSAETERTALLAEARKFLALPPGDNAVDRDVYKLVERYVAAIESTAGRLSLAEEHGRARALIEIANGALEPIDGTEVTFGEFRPDAPLVVLETTTPRRRGFLRETLARERARALLQAPPLPSPAPSAAGLLGEERTKELWLQATRGALRPAWGFCRQHGMVPLAETMDGRRQCYLGCSLDGPEVA